MSSKCFGSHSLPPATRNEQNSNRHYYQPCGVAPRALHTKKGYVTPTRSYSGTSSKEVKASRIPSPMVQSSIIPLTQTFIFKEYLLNTVEKD